MALCDSFLGEGGGRGLMNLLSIVQKPLPAFAHIPAHPSRGEGTETNSKILSKLPTD